MLVCISTADSETIMISHRCLILCLSAYGASEVSAPFPTDLIGQLFFSFHLLIVVMTFNRAYLLCLVEVCK